MGFGLAAIIVYDLGDFEEESLPFVLVDVLGDLHVDEVEDYGRQFGVEVVVGEGQALLVGVEGHNQQVFLQGLAHDLIPLERHSMVQ